MIKQIVVIRNDLKMRKGKIAAQSAHASMKFIVDQIQSSLLKQIENKTFEEIDQDFLVRLNVDQIRWIVNSFTKIVVYVNSEQELKDLIEKAKEKGVVAKPIVDSGRTEFHGVPTLTCVSFGPNNIEILDELTGHLPLL